jgi:hypothetical protein
MTPSYGFQVINAKRARTGKPILALADCRSSDLMYGYSVK